MLVGTGGSRGGGGRAVGWGGVNLGFARSLHLAPIFSPTFTLDSTSWRNFQLPSSTITGRG